MDKAEMERQLIDPEALSRLAARARSIEEALDTDEPVTQESRAIRRVVSSPAINKATDEEIRSNDLSHTQRRSLLANIGTLLPELADATPLNALATLIDRFKSYPSEATEFLVTDGINRLTHVGKLQGESEGIVSKAIETLIAVKLPNQDSAEEKDGIWSFLFQHSDMNGPSVFAYLGPSSIYRAVRKTFLQTVDLNDAISSLTLDASAGEVRGDVILFQNDRFFGRFTGVRTDADNPTLSVGVSYVGGHINDRTSSILLARRYAGEKVKALGDSISEALISNIIEDVKKVKKLKGSPIFTWDMWPTGGDRHPNDPDKRFVQINIPVEIEVNNWWNYDAEIWLWIYLYISGGDLRGYVAYYGAEVESGLISGSVLDGIMEELPDKLGEIDSLIDAQLSPINLDGPYSKVYLLPGDQTLFSGKALEGNTEDNVSVVLVPRDRFPVYTLSSYGALA